MDLANMRQNGPPAFNEPKRRRGVLLIVRKAMAYAMIGIFVYALIFFLLRAVSSSPY
jgi:hypothetical protein